jgi:hypothetical protein
MSYYKDQLHAFQDLDKILVRLKEEREDTTLTFIVYEVTKEYPVSAKVIKKRIQDWAEINNVPVINDFLKLSKVRD